jgi:hypothetical protein
MIKEKKIKNYEDIEIQKLKINKNTIINNSIHSIYLVLSIIIGLLLLLLSK